MVAGNRQNCGELPHGQRQSEGAIGREAMFLFHIFEPLATSDITWTTLD
jgi:hypothetical protein